MNSLVYIFLVLNILGAVFNIFTGQLFYTGLNTIVALLLYSSLRKFNG